MAAEHLVLDASHAIEAILPTAAGASSALHRAAMAWHAGAYDAICLDLARRLDVPIATRDRGMAAAARSAGVSVFRGDARADAQVSSGRLCLILTHLSGPWTHRHQSGAR